MKFNCGMCAEVEIVFGTSIMSFNSWYLEIFTRFKVFVLKLHSLKVWNFFSFKFEHYFKTTLCQEEV